MSFNGARPKEKNHSRCKKDGHSEDQKPKNKRTTEEDSCELYRHLSFRLYDVLDHVGASEEFRKLRQDCSISREIISTIYWQLLENVAAVYVFGSSSEGTTIPSLNSDLDTLFCTDTPFIENISEAGVNEAGDGLSLLMVRDKHSQPGYVKLQRVYNGQPHTVYDRDIDRDMEECDSQGRICLKHETNLGKFNFVDARNGPADTDTKHNVDRVNGYRCSTIPEFAREWIVRNRQYKWPSKRMLDKMTNMGCFVVGVGHPASRERTIEWRLSFSLQEREMMFSMNMTQHKCYVLLKIIKKDLIEPIVGKSISSYHLKTCMFHAFENTRLSFWKRENLCHCGLLCLFVMFKWVYIGYCPNYFIPEENMFDRDIHRQQRFNLLHQLHFILSHGCGFLFLIKLDNIGNFFGNGICNVHIESRINTIRFRQKIDLIIAALYFRLVLCFKANEQDIARTILCMISKYVSKTKSIEDHTEQQIQQALSYILPYIHLQLAQSYASRAFNTYNEGYKCERLLKSGYHLREARHCDLTSSILLKATVCLKLEQYDRCAGILHKLEQELNQTPFLICPCIAHSFDVTNEHVRQLNTLPLSEIFGRTPTCMIFLRSDMSITPKALRYEMFRSTNTPPGTRDRGEDAWFDLAVIDAIVYLHFLQYLVHAKLNHRLHKNIAIDRLEFVLRSNKNLGHRETGYNLLGWIHLHEHLIPQAIKYFKKSWAIRPHHNAAKLHMLMLIRDINS